MSTRRYVDVWCDGPGPESDEWGCGNWCEGATDKNAALARRNARALGWTRKAGRDLCPSCAKREERS